MLVHAHLCTGTVCISPYVTSHPQVCVQKTCTLVTAGGVVPEELTFTKYVKLGAHQTSPVMLQVVGCGRSRLTGDLCSLFPQQPSSLLCNLATSSFSAIAAPDACRLVHAHQHLHICRHDQWIVRPGAQADAVYPALQTISMWLWLWSSCGLSLELRQGVYRLCFCCACFVLFCEVCLRHM